MTAVRDYAGRLVTVPVVRDYRSALTGTVAVVPVVRDYLSLVSGVAAVLVSPMDPVTLGPGESKFFYPVLASGGFADSWTWRQVSGPPVTLYHGEGDPDNYLTVVAPSLMPPGQNLVFGARATLGGVNSTEQTITFTVLPQLEWTRVPGGAWTGAVVAPAADPVDIPG